MIIKAKSITRSHAINALNYIIKEEKDHLILGYDGADISSASKFVSDCDLYQKDRVKKSFISMVISPHVDNNLSIDDFKKLLLLVQEELKLTNRQYYAVIHRNTKTPHIHLISNRIDYQHKTFNDHHIAWDCQTACIKICKILSIKNGFQYNRQNEYSKLEKEYDIERWNKLQVIRAEFNKIKFVATNIDQVYNHLISQGIKVDKSKYKNGKYGVSISIDGETFKASKVDPLLTLLPNGDSYKANNKMQVLLDNNALRSEGLRTGADIKKEMGEVEGDKSRLKALIEEQAFVIWLMTHKPKKKNEEFDDYKPKRKYRVGLKVQIK